MSYWKKLVAASNVITLRIIYLDLWFHSFQSGSEVVELKYGSNADHGFDYRHMVCNIASNDMISQSWGQSRSLLKIKEVLTAVDLQGCTGRQTHLEVMIFLEYRCKWLVTTEKLAQEDSTHYYYKPDTLMTGTPRTLSTDSIHASKSLSTPEYTWWWSGFDVQ